MTTETDFHHTIFELVRRRLVERSDSLQRFFKHWQGSASGIEGWFKLEFAAAVEPNVAVVRTGGAGGRGRTGQFPDFILVTPGGAEIPVETKATGSNWWFGGADAATRYEGRLLAFLAPSQTPLPPNHRKRVEALDENIQLAPIYDVQGKHGTLTFYFGLADLR
jgi:hypothetical protein